jgi:hypothetical protein
MDSKVLQKRIQKLESQSFATWYRWQYHAKTIPARARLLRRCRALGQAMADTFNEDYFS